MSKNYHEKLLFDEDLHNDAMNLSNAIDRTVQLAMARGCSYEALRIVFSRGIIAMSQVEMEETNGAEVPNLATLSDDQWESIKLTALSFMDEQREWSKVLLLRNAQSPGRKETIN